MENIKGYLEKVRYLTVQYPDYDLEAYHFVMSSLNYIVTKLQKPRHITGAEMSHGVKDYALDQFGPMAKTVLNHWGIYETFDLGKIVYRLIDVKLMAKNDQDSITDFRDVFSFDQFIGKNYNYLEDLEKKSEMKTVK